MYLCNIFEWTLSGLLDLGDDVLCQLRHESAFKYGVRA